MPVKDITIFHIEYQQRVKKNQNETEIKKKTIDSINETELVLKR